MDFRINTINNRASNLDQVSFLETQSLPDNCKHFHNITIMNSASHHRKRHHHITASGRYSLLNKGYRLNKAVEIELAVTTSHYWYVDRKDCK